MVLNPPRAQRLQRRGRGSRPPSGARSTRSERSAI